MNKNFIAAIIFGGLAAFSLSGCVERPENEMIQEVERADPGSGIDLTTQVDGTFKGFADEEKNEVILEVDGEEKAYSLAEEATGDLDALEAGDAVSFTTKTENGRELIETLREK